MDLEQLSTNWITWGFAALKKNVIARPQQGCRIMTLLATVKQSDGVIEYCTLVYSRPVV
jgi:hypothetical protein